MSTFVLKREYALQLPNNYVEIDRDEMEYVDGGLSIPNWLVAGAVNWTIDAVVGAATGGGALALRSLAKRYGLAAAKTIFSSSLKKRLMAKAISASISYYMCGFVGVAYEIMCWASDPGSKFAEWLNSRDSNPYNESWDI